MKSRYFECFLSVFVLLLLITGCGGSGSSPNPPASISVSFSPQPPSSLDAGTNTNLTAMVSNDSANAGVTWTVSCGGSPCGSFSSASTASGAATKYSAPASAPKPATVTVTATSVTDSTKSVTATITISAPSAPITVTLNSPPTSVPATTTAALTATVANDSANAGVTWTVTCGSAQCGSFGPATTPSGTATTYTAPAAPPAPATVTVTATAVSDSTKTASATITITAAPPVLADGSYVFHVAGTDGANPYFVAGAFTVLNGAISAGEQDMTDGPYKVQDQISPSQSSLNLASGNIQIVLNTNDANIGVNGIETFRGTVVNNTRVLIEEYDTFATATGSLDAQTSTAAPAGGYAFNLGGLDGTNASTASWLVIGGILNISGSSISTGSSVYDYNDGGTIAQKQSFASGSVGAADAFGRVVFTLAPSSGLHAFAFAGYTVGTGQIQLVETTDILNGALGGTALGQGSNAGTFNQASVAGNSYAFGASGMDNTQQGSFLVQMAGGLGLNADSTVSGAMAYNDVNVQFGATITGGSYTVDSTGRVTVAATITSNTLSSPVNLTFQLYLDGNGNALELGVDNAQATSGPAFVQQTNSSDFEGNYAVNAYGYSPINNEPAWSAAGPITIASDAVSGYTDYSLQNQNNVGSTLIAGITLTGAEDSAKGLLTLQGLYAGDLPTPGQTISGFGYYPIDGERVIALELDNQSGLMMLEGIQPN